MGNFEGLVVAAIVIAGILIWRYFRGDRRMESRNTKIVIVGMERSAKYGSCPGSAHDAEAMRQILSKYGSPVVLRDSAARKSAVVSALRDAMDSDLVIFYYSGHGGSERTKTDKKETDGKDEYLCLYDGPMVDNEIWSIISGAKGRVFCIFDCCHSATMYQMVDGKVTEDKLRPFTFQMVSGPMEQQDVNLLVWSGCPDADFSYGDSDGGVFTNAIVESYRESRTYQEVWDKARVRVDSQVPAKTQIGVGFGGKVFC